MNLCLTVRVLRIQQRLWSFFSYFRVRIGLQYLDLPAAFQSETYIKVIWLRNRNRRRILLYMQQYGGGSRGGGFRGGGCSNCSFSTTYFIFMGNFKKGWINWSNRTPLCKLESPIQNSRFRPCNRIALSSILLAKRCFHAFFSWKYYLLGYNTLLFCTTTIQKRFGWINFLWNAFSISGYCKRENLWFLLFYVIP